MTKTAQPHNLEATEQMVTRFFQMLNTHCFANVVPLLTPDAEVLADEKSTGHDAVSAYFMRLWDAYPCISFVTQNLIVGETGACAEVTYQNGPNNTGARCMVFQFKGDLIRRVRCY